MSGSSIFHFQLSINLCFSPILSALTTQEGVSVRAVNKARETAEHAVEVKQQDAEIAIKQTADKTQKGTLSSYKQLTIYLFQIETP